MEFFLDYEPSRTTAQQKGVKVIGKRVHHYKKAKVVEEERKLRAMLHPHVPLKPMEGPLMLRVCWQFKCRTKKAHNTWKITRPDTDNLNKGLKDVMGAAGFFHDDAQIVREDVTKIWSLEPGLKIQIEELEERVT